MSTINFGSTVSMTTAATPSQGWIIGYDLDGFLKQKDTSGTIIQIGVGGTAGISATPSLLDVIKVGPSTGTYSIEMGSNTSLITSGNNNQINFGTSALEISTNDGTYFGLNSIKQSLGEISISMTDLTSNTASTIDLNSISINNRVGDLTIYSLQNITPNSYYVTLNDTSLLSGQIDIIKSESTYDAGSLNKSSLHLNSYNSTTYGGIANSVIIGGSDMIADENNTVYVPQLVIKDGDRIKSGAGYGLLEFNSANDVILATDKPIVSNSIIGIFSSTSSSVHLSGKNGILVRDTTTYSSTPAVQSPVTSISSESSFIESGIYNSVIIGGVNLSATDSNTVYLGNSVNINNAYKLPNVDGSLSEVLLTDGAGQAYWGTAPASTTPTLEQVLTQGNDSLGQNIVMGTGTSIVSGNGGGRIYLDEGFTSGNVVISTNNGSISDTYIDMNTSDLIMYSPSVFNLNFDNSTVISANLEGLRYAFDYSATFVTYSLIDKNYVDSNFLSQVDNTSIELNGSNQVSLKSIIDGNRQFNDSVTILGDLAILGTTSTIYTENLVVEDNFITLNGTYSGPAIDAGIEVNLGDGTYSKIFWSSSYQYWNAGLSGSEQTIVTDAMNGLSQTDNKIGLGGVLSLNTIIYGQGYNLDIIDVGQMTITASSFIDNKVYSTNTNTSRQFNDGDNYFTRVDDAIGTYSYLDIKPDILSIGNYDGVGYSIINFYSQKQVVTDGSSNNIIIVDDDHNQKGIVYRDDYTANFTTYSLVTKGYVDSAVNLSLSIGTTSIISGTNFGVLFQSGGVVQQDDSFIYNDSQKILGLPALEILSQTSSSSYTSLRVKNYNNTSDFISILGDGNINVGSSTAATVSSTFNVYSGFSGGNYLKLINDTSNFDTYQGIDMAHTGRPGYFALETAGNQGSSITRFRGGGSTNANAKITAYIDHPGDVDKTGHWHFRTQVHLGDAYRSFDSSYGRHTLVIENGVGPTASPTNSFIQYSADITSGNAAPHFRTENGSVVKLYQETTGVSSATYSSIGGPGSTQLTDLDTFDGYTLQQVVRALRNLGLLA